MIRFTVTLLGILAGILILILASWLLSHYILMGAGWLTVMGILHPYEAREAIAFLIFSIILTCLIRASKI